MPRREASTAEPSAFLERRGRVTQVHLGISLFDLARDPDERQNLYEGGDSSAAPLFELLARFVQAPSPVGEKLAIDAELQEKLRSLGYLQ